ncbi:hypothetical protein [Actinomadura sp. HBU206391]|uniref:hypothetical protein n=1 Tax=Actinomadura sp. HBU206391 TaxID=2731692 RepID=UPI001C9D2A45|nr:hypothetical protein [Actinomadura sp. HBU206391]
MRRAETPQEIAHTRTVRAETVLTGRVDLRGYPHRHLAVVSHNTHAAALMEAMASAEHLSQWGWELVNMSNVGGTTTIMCAVMRRTG